MSAVSTASPPLGSLLQSLISDEAFRPAEPRSIAETGLTATAIEGLILKQLLVLGSISGRSIAEKICLPFCLLEEVFQSLRSRQLATHSGSAPLNDYVYALTESGRERARNLLQACQYVGPAPVPLDDYLSSVEAQTIRTEMPNTESLAKAFQGLEVSGEMLDNLGPAINSGAGLFLYGPPGNGKTSLARRITRCFGQNIWIPQTITEDGQIIKLYDSAVHELQGSEQPRSSLLKSAAHDNRWIKITRPTVVVGGELTLDMLEIRHDPYSNVSEAPLQLKSNCGCLLIDDFGRQRIQPQDLLNRWIIPLENRIDYLTLITGRKIQVPFEQLIIFSTNLEPNQLADDAFLRRIPYKIEVGDPTLAEFHRLFELACQSAGCAYRAETVDWLINCHYTTARRPLRRCQPRDLVAQVRNFCRYRCLPLELKAEYLDRAARTYFTALSGT